MQRGATRLPRSYGVPPWFRESVSRVVIIARHRQFLSNQVDLITAHSHIHFEEIICLTEKQQH